MNKWRVRRPCLSMHRIEVGGPLGYLRFSMMALIRDPIYTNMFQGLLGANPGNTPPHRRLREDQLLSGLNMGSVTGSL